MSWLIFFCLTYFLYICLQTILKLLMTGESGNKRAGIMIPIPQYPLYTATIAEYNAYPVSLLSASLGISIIFKGFI